MEKDCHGNITVQKGNRIDIYIDDIYLYNLPKKINYVYSDDNIVIAYKPQGVLSNNEGEKIEEPTFEDLVKKDFSTAKICHRLDRNTSGLLIFSLNELAHQNILKELNNNNISKEYVAYVGNSNFKKKHEILESYILTDKKTGYSKIYDKKIGNSSLIITEIEVLDKDEKNEIALLNVKIKTGKTHQIRAQLKAISHPIIGDPKYGDNMLNKKYGIYKQLLCAYKYTFFTKNNSVLNYLNNKEFKLNENVYFNRIGDFNEKRNNK